MPRISNTAEAATKPAAVQTEPAPDYPIADAEAPVADAPVYQVLSDDPAQRARIETLVLLLQAIANTESSLAKWAGGNTQFEATRFMLGGRLEALRAVYQALEGEPELLRNL